MSGSKAKGSGKARQGKGRVIQVSPLARAMHVALAASLALAGSGMAVAGTCTPSTSGTVECAGVLTNGSLNSSVQQDVPDLTRVVGSEGVPNSVTPAAGGIHLSDAGSAAITSLDGVSASDTPKADFEAAAFTVNIRNNGPITKSDSGDVVGIHADFPGADVRVTNRANGVIDVESTDGLADGIFAYGEKVRVNNQGSIAANGFDWAAGVEVQSYDLTTVSNSGDISAVATANDDPTQTYGQAFGIYATGGAAGVNASNSGNITADGVFATGVLAQGGGPVTASNTGDITIGSDPSLITTYYATGIHASNNYGNTPAMVDNSGTITAIGYFAAIGISDVSTGEGSIPSVTNSGTITAIAGEPTQGHATGVLVSGDGGVDVRNSAGGTVSASGAYAYAVDALTFNGDANVVSHGDMTASATSEGGQAFAYGVRAYSQNGNASVTNTGSLSAIVTDGVNNALLRSRARGIQASGVGVDVVNRGRIEAYGGYGNGISAFAGTGDATILNEGLINASGQYGYGVYTHSVDGDVHVTNAAAGLINTNGYFAAGGVFAISTNGDVDLVNAGRIVTGDNEFFKAFGLRAFSNYGNATAVNSGIIQTNSHFNAFGIEASVRGHGVVTVGNSGIIEAAAETASAAGVNAFSSTGASVNVVNSGTITTFAGWDKASGIYTQALGDIAVNNLGSITASAAYGNGIGISAKTEGDVVISSSGHIDAMASHGLAAGILGDTWHGNVSIGNRGSIRAYSPDSLAIGMYGVSQDGSVAVGNAGSIDAVSRDYDAIGIHGIVSGGDLTLVNTARGSISATSVDGDAIGLQGTITDAGVTVNNAGSISVASTNGTAYAIRIVDGSEGLAPGSANIVNSGSITGAIATGAGNDRLTNRRNATWDVAGTASSFGAGNDTLVNAWGGKLILADSGVTFGAGENSFSNAGTIKVSGHSFVDMTDGSAEAATAALVRPKHGASFTNNGIIDFLDGAADDSLTITGGFGGRGSINLDVSLDNQLNDQLFVQGGVLNGTKQRVNVALLDGLPKSSDVGQQLELVHVSGDTNPSVFVGGEVLGVSPRDFMSMGLTLSSTPDKGAKAGDGSSYLLTVKTHVDGLNSAGVLASSAALGVDSLMTSTTGSRRDRTYSLSASGNKPAFATIVPWVRDFRDEGGMSPDHLSGNFGQMSASRLSQDNFGTEMGLELQAANGFRFGTLFAKSEGKQYLVDERGMDTIRGSTLGLYSSWVSPSGFYADASWRTMRFEANIDSIGGRQRSEGNAVASNIEAGYTWSLGNGLNVEPQLGYTATTVDGLRIQGDQATFESQDANWTRGRAGVSLWKTYGGASGWRWTPRAELDMVRTFEGIASYSINDDYFGNVMTEGTSALVKFGLGASRGRLSWNGGVNWMDGANFNSALGGQMTLQYSW